MRRFVPKALAFVSIGLVHTVSFAAVGAVPEPGVLELAGLGIAVAVAVRWAKNRRK